MTLETGLKNLIPFALNNLGAQFKIQGLGSLFGKFDCKADSTLADVTAFLKKFEVQLTEIQSQLNSIKAEIRELRYLITKDELTGIYNHVMASLDTMQTINAELRNGEIISTTKVQNLIFSISEIKNNGIPKDINDYLIGGNGDLLQQIASGHKTETFENLYYYVKAIYLQYYSCYHSIMGLYAWVNMIRIPIKNKIDSTSSADSKVPKKSGTEAPYFSQETIDAVMELKDALTDRFYSYFPQDVQDLLQKLYGLDPSSYATDGEYLAQPEGPSITIQSYTEQTPVVGLMGYPFEYIRNAPVASDGKLKEENITLFNIVTATAAPETEMVNGKKIENYNCQFRLVPDMPLQNSTGSLDTQIVYSLFLNATEFTAEFANQMDMPELANNVYQESHSFVLGQTPEKVKIATYLDTNATKEAAKKMCYAALLPWPKYPSDDEPASTYYFPPRFYLYYIMPEGPKDRGRFVFKWFNSQPVTNIQEASTFPGAGCPLVRTQAHDQSVVALTIWPEPDTFSLENGFNQFVFNNVG